MRHLRPAAATLAALLVCTSLQAGETFRADMDASQAVDAFLAEFGSELHVDFDFQTGYPRDLYGRAMDLGWKPSTDAEFESAARNLLDAYSAMFGFDTGAISSVDVNRLNLSAIGTTNKVAVNLHQGVSNIDVPGGSVSFLFLESGELVCITNYGLPGVQNVDLVPAIDEDQALSLAQVAFGHEVGGLLGLDLAIVRDASGAGATLAYEVELLATEAKNGVPVQERISVDARTGDVLRKRTTVHTATDLIGRVNGWTSPGNDPDQGANEVKETLHFVHADGSVGAADTDINGDFTIVYGGNQNQSVVVDFDADSKYAYVVNDTGNSMAVTKTMTPGVLTKWNLNGKKRQKRTAQVNAHKHIVVMLQWIKGLNAADNTMERQFRTNVNINACCNAYYNGSSTNYYLAGCGCVNTAYSTVVYHEMGHWANDRYSSGNGGDGFGEGNADNWATHISDDPIVGKNFCGNGCHVRDARNTRQYCNNSCGNGCYGGVHADGEVLMGAVWKVRTRLNTSLGDAAGDSVSNHLFLNWMNGYNDSAICENVRTHYLILDDTDGNIDNGTPHSADIDNGFKDQGFPGYY